MTKLRFFGICASMITILLYIITLLIIYLKFQLKNLIDVFKLKIVGASGFVITIYSIWVLSTIYMDIYLWHRRSIQKDQSARELEIYSRTEWGGEDAPIAGKKKWLVAYPIYLMVLILGWYSVIFLN